MLKFPRKKKFVDISLEKKGKRTLKLQWFVFFRTLTKVELFLLTFSIITFLGIFGEKILAKKFLGLYEEKIRNTQLNIERYKKQIELLKEELSKANTKFQDFYIPLLKEKLFYIWYEDIAQRKINLATAEFSRIVGTTTPFVGVLSYPNPYFLPKELGDSYIISSEHKVVYKVLKVNPFTGLKNINKNFVVVIDIPKTDTGFAKQISQIKSESLKANLMLEYTLLQNGIKNLRIKTPMTLIFPVNVALPAGYLYDTVFAKLKKFCSELIVNQEYRKEIFINNKIQTKVVLDAFCVKNIY